MKKLLTLILMAGTMLAEQVVMTDNGKTFHAKENCTMLRKAKALFTAERADAEAHGLHACRSCYKTPAAAKPAKNAWGKPLPTLPTLGGIAK